MTKPASVDGFLVHKRDLKNSYFSMTFYSPEKKFICKPGQFFHVQLPESNIYFRRAFSIASVSTEKFESELIFKIFGRATKIMGRMKKGDNINL
jgi:NAD(P)H-flavin reductase